jgi:hypothetical protein
MRTFTKLSMAAAAVLALLVLTVQAQAGGFVYWSTSGRAVGVTSPSVVVARAVVAPPVMVRPPLVYYGSGAFDYGYRTGYRDGYSQGYSVGAGTVYTRTYTSMYAPTYIPYSSVYTPVYSPVYTLPGYRIITTLPMHSSFGRSGFHGRR